MLPLSVPICIAIGMPLMSFQKSFQNVIVTIY